MKTKRKNAGLENKKDPRTRRTTQHNATRTSTRTCCHARTTQTCSPSEKPVQTVGRDTTGTQGQEPLAGPDEGHRVPHPPETALSPSGVSSAFVVVVGAVIFFFFFFFFFRFRFFFSCFLPFLLESRRVPRRLRSEKVEYFLDGRCPPRIVIVHQLQHHPPSVRPFNRQSTGGGLEIPPHSLGQGL